MSRCTCKDCGDTFTDSANCYDIKVTGYCGHCLDDIAEDNALSEYDKNAID